MQFKEQTIGDFCASLAAGTPTPGGGTTAAIAGAMGAALVAMVAGLTIGREKFAAVQEEMADLQQTGNQEMAALLHCADVDGAAFNQVMAAFALPKGTAEEKAERQAAVQAAYKEATYSPLTTMKHAATVMKGALGVVARGNPNAMSDGRVAYLMSRAAFEGGLFNVAINLPAIKDEAFKQEVSAELERLKQQRSEMDAAFEALQK